MIAGAAGFEGGAAIAYHTVGPGPFPEPVLETLARRILAHPMLADRNLTGGFVGTRGFSVVFRQEGLAKVHARFPEFRGFCDALLDPGCNAWYLNPLVLVRDARVDAHVDRSLRAYCPPIETPRWVTVLYVAVPDGLRGGELVLRHGRREVARIAPAPGQVVRFQGDLTHEVRAMAPGTPGPRVSLVCEQYDLEPEVLAALPAFGLEKGGKRY